MLVLTSKYEWFSSPPVLYINDHINHSNQEESQTSGHHYIGKGPKFPKSKKTVTKTKTIKLCIKLR